MTSFAFEGSPQSPGAPQAPEDNRQVRLAVLTLVGTVVTGLTTFGVAYVSRTNGDGDITSASTTAQVTEEQSSPLTGVGEVLINEDDSEVTVTGWAAANVDQVLVTIGPRKSGGQWANVSSVTDGRWETTIGTDPKLSRPYKVDAVPKSTRAHVVSGYAVQATTPTTASGSEDVVNCVEQGGTDCFSGPEWGPPAVYRGE